MNPCKVCGATDHDGRKHRRKRPAGFLPAHNGPKSPRAAAVPEFVQQPLVVHAGARFVVVELLVDVPDEHESVGIWIADDVWVARTPTGREVDGYAEWLLEREGRPRARVRGFPQLFPLFPCAPSSLRPARVVRGARQRVSAARG